MELLIGRVAGIFVEFVVLRQSMNDPSGHYRKIYVERVIKTKYVLLL